MNYPSYIQLYPTLRCNQGCSFCFNQGISSSFLNKDMNLKDTYLLRDMLVEKGISEIDILGGEPLLVPWMKDFVIHATEDGISLNISTNGSLPEVVGQFAEGHTNSINFGFSFEGFSETHNALTKSKNFSKAITGLKMMIAAEKNPIVKSTLMKENIDEIYDLISYFAGLGVKRYYILHEDIIGRQKNSTCFSFPEFWKFYSKIKTEMAEVLDVGFVAASGFYSSGLQLQGRCDAGIKKIAVFPDGSAFPCNLFAGFEEFRLGNILEDGMEKIWGNPLLEKFRKYDGNNRCKRDDCNHYLNCRGGCPAHSYYFYGTLDRVDPRCGIK
ncbi:MAG: radical SAM protein [Nitrospirota bacterium]